jgi:ATP-dependent DNA ligase
MSGYLLERLGIDENDLRDAVARAAGDDEVAAWVRAHTDASRYAEISATIRAVKPKHTADPEYFLGIYAETVALHPELERVIDIIEADDRRLFEGGLRKS